MARRTIIYCWMFFLFFSVSMLGKAQEASEDSLCALWFNKCAECINKQQLDEAEKYIVSIEKTSNKEVFVEVAKYCRMNLAFHKAMEKYQHSRYDEALAIATDGLQYLENKRVKPKEVFSLPKLVADCLIHKGSYEDARNIYEGLHQLAIQYDIKEIEAESLSWIASSYQKVGNYEKSLYYYKQAYELLYKLESPKTKYAASGLKRLYKHHFYNQEKSDYWAIKEQDAQKFTKKGTLQDAIWTNYSFATLAKMKTESLDSFHLNKKQAAIDISSKWIKGAEEGNSKDSLLLADAYWWRATFYSMVGKNVAALKDLSMGLKLIGNHKDENRELLYRIWNTVASCYTYSKQYEKAIEANRQAIGNASIIFGKTSLKVAQEYYNISNNEKWLKNYNRQLQNFCTYSSIIKERIRNDFYFLNKQERAAYWQRIGKTVSEMPQIMFDYGITNDVYADSLYNLILFSKGLLLNAEIEEKTQATNRPDYLYTSVEKIRQCLSSKSVAVEFCESTYVLDTTICAVIVSKNSTHAQLVKLGKKKDFISTMSSLLELYDCVWNPMESYLKNIDTIYFSPVGILNILPIESATETAHKRIMYRLSSTRVLITTNNSHSQPVKRAAIFGGINYDVSLTSNRSNNNPKQGTGLERGIRGAVDISYLPQTKIEAEQILDCLNKNNVKTDYFLADRGTEEAFKKLIRKEYSIIHLATHGFYTPSEEEENKPGHLLEKIRDGDKNLQREWELLHNCGLLMAGAQHSMWNEQSIDQENDGILTAQEISTLDFHSLDLVSLSACQSGQGEITGDGVFGLQRGFKKAGAQSILMSLWRVDDEATCMLMTEFYKNWISENMSKHYALEEAKKTVRSHKEKGWDDPKYWAAFILLDALD